MEKYVPVVVIKELSETDTIARLRGMFPQASIHVERPLPSARHLFSHIEWQLSGWIVHLDGNGPLPALPDGYAWAAAGDMADFAIPGAFKAYKPLLLGEGT